MSDTIYRQAAIDAVSRGCLEFRGIFAECEKNLNELPPAQSDNGYSDGFCDGYKQGIKDAQSEIIRCKDCKHLDIQGTYGECGKGLLGIVNRDDFCSRAERREDG